MNIDKLKNELNKNGFVVFNSDTTSQELLKIAAQFGKVVPGDNGDFVQQLFAQEKGHGSHGSFSYCVGYAPFPWHTDTAYWDVPTRYLLLTSETPSSCATLAQSFESLSSAIMDFPFFATRAVFLLDIPGKRRYITPAFRINGIIGYKFDFHIYKPVNKEAELLSEMIIEQLIQKHQRILWTGDNVVILDNWRIIHSREDAHNDKCRTLKRIYINELV